MKNELYKLAKQIYDKEIFDLLEMGTMFALKNEEDIFYSVIEDQSIFMYKNQRGFESWVDLISQEDEISDLKALELEYMKYGFSISFDEFDNLTKYEKKELKDLEIDYKEFSLIPRFLKHEELTLPYRIKETDIPVIKNLLLTLSDIITNNYDLFENDEKFFAEESEDLEEQIPCSTLNNGKINWSKIDLPDDFDRFPSPALLEKSLAKYRSLKVLKNKAWNFHLFIIPNANNSKAHLFPIAGIVFDEESKDILTYKVVKDWDAYYHDFLEDLLSLMAAKGKPATINVSSHRAESLLKKLCKQLKIELNCYLEFEDTDRMEVQLIKNFNY